MREPSIFGELINAFGTHSTVRRAGSAVARGILFTIEVDKRRVNSSEWAWFSPHGVSEGIRMIFRYELTVARRYPERSTGRSNQRLFQTSSSWH